MILLILSETFALYKSFTYLLTYLLTRTHRRTDSIRWHYSPVQ